MTAPRAVRPLEPSPRREARHAPTEAPAVEIADVHRAYGPSGNHVLALAGVTLTAEPGAFVCLVGASGCGKSTLLNILAGLDRPQLGHVTVRGRVALLFQEAALFPWLSASGNVELALRLAGVPRRERRDRARQLLDMVQLTEFADRQPHELSGGMRQRVAVARALAQGADILLMDEPFGSLDAMTRDLLHDELERIWLDTRLTVVFVTHDVREAVRLGDRVAVLTSRPGRVAAELDVDLDRPRQLSDPAVGRMAEQITERLRDEVVRHADD